MNPSTICRRYRVIGRVQGVFFRVSTRDKANSLGVTGWVRNTQNNDVELIACGDENQLKQLEEWLQQGPPLAVVQSVSSEIIEELSFKNFSLQF